MYGDGRCSRYKTNGHVQEVAKTIKLSRIGPGPLQNFGYRIARMIEAPMKDPTDIERQVADVTLAELVAEARRVGIVRVRDRDDIFELTFVDDTLSRDAREFPTSFAPALSKNFLPSSFNSPIEGHPLSTPSFWKDRRCDMELAKILKAVEEKLAAIDVELHIWEQALTITVAEAQTALEQARANRDWNDPVKIEADTVAIDDDRMASIAYSAVRQISVTFSDSLRNFS